jgi:hypothetical protein
VRQHRPPPKFLKKFFDEVFFRVVVRSRTVAGTVFGEHDFSIMSVELAPGIAIVSITFSSLFVHSQQT